MSTISTEVNRAEREPSASFVVRSTMHEILSDVTRAREVFELDEQSEQKLTAQIEAHQGLTERVNHFIDMLPSPYATIDDLVAQGAVAAQDATEFYLDLNTFLQDPWAARSVLYMPFEWLPDPHSRSEEVELRDARTTFLETYTNTWWSLLREHDIRAEYEDGDMRLDIDANTDNLPRVIKAAHLIPFLLVRDVITEDDVWYIYDGTNSQVLKASIDDAMMVYRHLGESQEPVFATFATLTTDMIHQYHESQLAQMYAEREAHASPQRLEWLEKVAFETTVQDMARGCDFEQAVTFLSGNDELLRSTGVIALGELAAHADDVLRARAIEALLDRGSPEIKYFSMTLIRLYHAGYVDETALIARGIRIPYLHGDLSHNLDLSDKEMETVRNYIDAVQGDEALCAQLFPAVIVGGSRLKGYGDEHSDVDVTILVRPGVDVREREALLAKVLPLLNGDKPHEFWLEYENKELHIRDIETNDQFVGNDYWVHVLFGGAWVGDEGAIRELQSRLYPSYFKDGYLEGTDMPLQPAYLKRIEDDVLLYRLLHRGYAHQFPTRGLHVPYAERIDGKGVFYDAGYRQLAMRLFIEKVFLPTI